MIFAFDETPDQTLAAQLMVTDGERCTTYPKKKKNGVKWMYTVRISGPSSDHPPGTTCRPPKKQLPPGHK